MLFRNPVECSYYPRSWGVRKVWAWSELQQRSETLFVFFLRSTSVQRNYRNRPMCVKVSHMEEKSHFYNIPRTFLRYWASLPSCDDLSLGDNVRNVILLNLKPGMCEYWVLSSKRLRNSRIWSNISESNIEYLYIRNVATESYAHKRLCGWND